MDTGCTADEVDGWRTISCEDDDITLYRRCCSHINSSLPGKCSTWSQDRLQYSGVEGYFRRKNNTKYMSTSWFQINKRVTFHLRAIKP